MAAQQSQGQGTFTVRKLQTGDNSEYYGIPLRITQGFGDSQYTRPSHITSPLNRNARYNYETSRSVPRSYKRHDSQQPPDDGKRRDDGTKYIY